jgi:RNA polymerase-binding transcription factor DksA
MKKRLVKKELDSYKEKLFNLKDDFLAQIKDISEDTLMKTQKDASGDMSGYGLHNADVASDNYERDLNISLISGEREIVIAIDEALKRVEDKSYGFCGSCEKAIAKKRLDTIPYANYCKKCKEKLEKENKV